MIRTKIVRIISITMIVIIICNIFTACGINDDGKEENGNKTSEQKDTPITDEEITLSYLSIMDEDLSAVLVNEFESRYPNINVEIIPYDLSTGIDQLSMMKNDNKMPDCFDIVGPGSSYVKDDMLYDISEYWKNDADAKNIIKGIW